jgi:hypothetical protein
MKTLTNKNKNGAGANLGKLCVGACVLGTSFMAYGQAVGERVEYSNRADLSVGGALVDGNRAAFQQRHQLPAGAFGGVESFYYEQDVTKQTTFRVEGRSIFEGHDYLLNLELVNPEFGYVRAGFREFRTWYDGSGGYFPPNDTWWRLQDDKLHIDKGEAWIEAGLTLPNWPVLSLRYTHQYREGMKDSTVWGDTGRIGLTGDFGGTRGLVPSFREIDESRNIFEGRLSHTLGNTDFGAGLRYEFSEQDNALHMLRRPLEPQQRYITHREGMESDIWSTHAWTRTRLHDRVQFSTGYMFTTLDTDLSGSRIYGVHYDPIYDPVYQGRQFRDYGFLTIDGGSKSKQHVGNLNFMITPIDHLHIVPSVRVEKEDLEGMSRFTRIGVPNPPVRANLYPGEWAMHDREILNVTERLEARYTGLQKWVFYARGEWSQGQIDLAESSIGFSNIERYTESDRNTQQYTVGANWYPARPVNAGVQYYHRIRKNSYDHLIDNTPNLLTSGDRYPAFLRRQDITTDDFNVRLTLRPLNNLTLVSRYDLQLSTIDTEAPFLPKIESGEMTSHIFSQSVTWMPISRLYLQASVNYAIDRTETPVDKMRPPEPNALRVSRAENDYLNTTFSLGYALDDKTDLNASYFYYLSDNYNNNALYSVPFGTGEHEHGVTAGLVRRIRDNVFLGFKYGFFSYREDTWGGNRNYDAHLLYSTLSMRF